MSKSHDAALESYFQDGDRWEQEILKSAKRSRAIAWFITMVFGTITLLSLTALILLVPLKSFEPYIIEVDKNTGYLEVKSGLTKSVKLTDLQAITQANVVRYIRSREGYDPFAVTENFGIAALLSTNDAARELQELYSAANPDNPAKIYGKDKKVTVDLKSVTFSNPSTALVRFSTTEKSDTGQITRHYISVVRYRYTESPATNAWRFENPLGFQVYDYRRDQETVTPGDAGQ
ncbi:type IV secretion system protein VirB8 [Rhizobium petrolearium]|uniref:virB8 family protein n=1 Tax=Neorhizobium petrolearium TaxID=515361 RepID=UPI001AE20322|nr:type IV secretion system protein [Neorhizobium petrolearium]MBP1844376.1 type IV secretion system protein VirB8 [Neorhizobium petrolearium]